jgi:hypothetical protein
LRTPRRILLRIFPRTNPRTSAEKTPMPHCSRSHPFRPPIQLPRPTAPSTTLQTPAFARDPHPPISIYWMIYLVSGWVLAALAFWGDFSQAPPNQASPERSLQAIQSFPQKHCQEGLRPSTALSREVLLRVVAVPERSPKPSLRKILGGGKEPILGQHFCQLPMLKIRAGITAHREAYPLASDLSTWLILLYEGEEYAGYSLDCPANCPCLSCQLSCQLSCECVTLKVS